MANAGMVMEVAADAILIGRYFGRSGTLSSVSRSMAAASSMTLVGGRNTPMTGDGPGIRMLNPNGNSATMFVGMSSAAGPGESSSARFFSVLTGRRTADPLVAAEVAKHF